MILVSLEKIVTTNIILGEKKRTDRPVGDVPDPAGEGGGAAQDGRHVPRVREDELRQFELSAGLTILVRVVGEGRGRRVINILDLERSSTTNCRGHYNNNFI